VELPAITVPEVEMDAMPSLPSTTSRAAPLSKPSLAASPLRPRRASPAAAAFALPLLSLRSHECSLPPR
jgi:hypothetical protein